MKPGKDFIGVGCGAVILNENKEVLLLKRGQNAKNNQGFWSIPGGALDFGETFEAAVKREIKEEVGLEIELLQLLCITDDFIAEDEHWVTPQYLAKIVAGKPHNCEPHKHNEVRWFSLDNLPEPLTLTTENSVKHLLKLKDF